MRAKNPRPAPQPPAAARPRLFNVTGVKTLIRDPFAVYAELVLGLRRLDPLRPEPDARLRGIALHAVLERFTRSVPPKTPDAAQKLSDLAQEVLQDQVPWPMARLLWQSRLDALRDDFIPWHDAREGMPALVERKGNWAVPGVDATLVGKPDRIDLRPDGSVEVFDYKTGTPPSKQQQRHFDKQLILLALMAQHGAFEGLGSHPVHAAAFVGLGSKFQTIEGEVSPDSLARHLTELQSLFSAYLEPDQGYTARRAMKQDSDESPYDALARLGEWQLTDRAIPQRVGDHDG